MIRILVADDHPVVREGIKRLVSSQPDMTVVAEADTGDDVEDAARSSQADVVLLDVAMPGPGLEPLLRRLRERLPDVRVLVLSVHPEQQYAAHALKAGALGYLCKDRTPSELARAIRLVHAGDVYMAPGVARDLADRLLHGRDVDPHERLSAREFDVLIGLGRGQSLKQIAGQLGVSSKTVSTYAARVRRKLGAASNVALVRYVFEHHLVE